MSAPQRVRKETMQRTAYRRDQAARSRRRLAVSTPPVAIVRRPPLRHVVRRAKRENSFAPSRLSVEALEVSGQAGEVRREGAQDGRGARQK